MTDYATHDQERTAADLRATLSSDAYLLGVDGEGALHYHALHDHQIHVVESDGTHRVRELDARPVSTWVGYIREERGHWRGRQPVELDAAGALAHAARREVV